MIMIVMTLISFMVIKMLIVALVTGDAPTPIPHMGIGLKVEVN
jgi:hypothetical protein